MSLRRWFGASSLLTRPAAVASASHHKVVLQTTCQGGNGGLDGGSSLHSAPAASVHQENNSFKDVLSPCYFSSSCVEESKRHYATKSTSVAATAPPRAHTEGPTGKNKMVTSKSSTHSSKRRPPKQLPRNQRFEEEILFPLFLKLEEEGVEVDDSFSIQGNTTSGKNDSSPGRLSTVIVSFVEEALKGEEKKSWKFVKSSLPSVVSSGGEKWGENNTLSEQQTIQHLLRILNHGVNFLQQEIEKVNAETDRMPFAELVSKTNVKAMELRRRRRTMRIELAMLVYLVRYAMLSVSSPLQRNCSSEKGAGGASFWERVHLLTTLRELTLLDNLENKVDVSTFLHEHRLTHQTSKTSTTPSLSFFLSKGQLDAIEKSSAFVEKCWLWKEEEEKELQLQLQEEGMDGSEDDEEEVSEEKLLREAEARCDEAESEQGRRGIHNISSSSSNSKVNTIVPAHWLPYQGWRRLETCQVQNQPLKDASLELQIVAGGKRMKGGYTSFELAQKITSVVASSVFFQVATLMEVQHLLLPPVIVPLKKMLLVSKSSPTSHAPSSSKLDFHKIALLLKLSLLGQHSNDLQAELKLIYETLIAEASQLIAKGVTSLEKFSTSCDKNKIQHFFQHVLECCTFIISTFNEVETGGTVFNCDSEVLQKEILTLLQKFERNWTSSASSSSQLALLLQQQEKGSSATKIKNNKVVEDEDQFLSALQSYFSSLKQLHKQHEQNLLLCQGGVHRRNITLISASTQGIDGEQGEEGDVIRKCFPAEISALFQTMSSYRTTHLRELFAPLLRCVSGALHAVTTKSTLSTQNHHRKIVILSLCHCFPNLQNNSAIFNSILANDLPVADLAAVALSPVVHDFPLDAKFSPELYFFEEKCKEILLKAKRNIVFANIAIAQATSQAKVLQLEERKKEVLEGCIEEFHLEVYDKLNIVLQVVVKYRSTLMAVQVARLLLFPDEMNTGTSSGTGSATSVGNSSMMSSLVHRRKREVIIHREDEIKTSFQINKGELVSGALTVGGARRRHANPHCSIVLPTKQDEDEFQSVEWLNLAEICETLQTLPAVGESIMASPSSPISSTFTQGTQGRPADGDLSQVSRLFIEKLVMLFEKHKKNLLFKNPQKQKNQEEGEEDGERPKNNKNLLRLSNTLPALITLVHLGIPLVQIAPNVWQHLIECLLAPLSYLYYDPNGDANLLEGGSKQRGEGVNGDDDDDGGHSFLAEENVEMEDDDQDVRQPMSRGKLETERRFIKRRDRQILLSLFAEQYDDQETVQKANKKKQQVRNSSSSSALSFSFDILTQHIQYFLNGVCQSKDVHHNKSAGGAASGQAHSFIAACVQTLTSPFLLLHPTLKSIHEARGGGKYLPMHIAPPNAKQYLALLQFLDGVKPVDISRSALLRVTAHGEQLFRVYQQSQEEEGAGQEQVTDVVDESTDQNNKFKQKFVKEDFRSLPKTNIAAFDLCALSVAEFCRLFSILVEHHPHYDEDFLYNALCVAVQLGASTASSEKTSGGKKKNKKKSATEKGTQEETGEERNCWSDPQIVTDFLTSIGKCCVQGATSLKANRMVENDKGHPSNNNSNQFLSEAVKLCSVGFEHLSTRQATQLLDVLSVSSGSDLATKSPEVEKLAEKVLMSVIAGEGGYDEDREEEVLSSSSSSKRKTKNEIVSAASSGNNKATTTLVKIFYSLAKLNLTMPEAVSPVLEAIAENIDALGGADLGLLAHAFALSKNPTLEFVELLVERALKLKQENPSPEDVGKIVKGFAALCRITTGEKGPRASTKEAQQTLLPRVAERYRDLGERVIRAYIAQMLQMYQQFNAADVIRVLIGLIEINVAHPTVYGCLMNHLASPALRQQLSVSQLSQLLILASEAERKEQSSARADAAAGLSQGPGRRVSPTDPIVSSREGGKGHLKPSSSVKVSVHTTILTTMRPLLTQTVQALIASQNAKDPFWRREGDINQLFRTLTRTPNMPVVDDLLRRSTDLVHLLPQSALLDVLDLIDHRLAYISSETLASDFITASVDPFLHQIGLQIIPRCGSARFLALFLSSLYQYQIRPWTSSMPLTAVEKRLPAVLSSADGPTLALICSCIRERRRTLMKAAAAHGTVTTSSENSEGEKAQKENSTSFPADLYASIIQHLHKHISVLSPKDIMRVAEFQFMFHIKDSTCLEFLARRSAETVSDFRIPILASVLHCFALVPFRHTRAFGAKALLDLHRRGDEINKNNDLTVFRLVQIFQALVKLKAHRVQVGESMGGRGRGGGRSATSPEEQEMRTAGRTIYKKFAALIFEQVQTLKERPILKKRVEEICRELGPKLHPQLYEVVCDEGGTAQQHSSDPHRKTKKVEVIQEITVGKTKEEEEAKSAPSSGENWDFQLYEKGGTDVATSSGKGKREDAAGAEKKKKTSSSSTSEEAWDFKFYSV